ARHPVDTEPWWIGPHPVANVRAERAGVALVVGQPIGLPETHEPLVSVQLPDHLVVADTDGVEMIQLTKVHSRSAPPRDGIKMQVDRVPEREIPVSQEVEPAAAERLGTSQHLVTPTARWRRRAGRALEEPRGAFLAEAFEEHLGRDRLVTR